MSPESYAWIVVLVVPISSLAILGIFLYGALFSRFRFAFGLIALAGVFFLISEVYWLAAKLQQSLGFALLSVESLRLLFPIQALSFYVGLVIVVTGDAVLVWQVTKFNSTRRT